MIARDGMIIGDGIIAGNERLLMVKCLSGKTASGMGNSMKEEETVGKN